MFKIVSNILVSMLLIVAPVVVSSEELPYRIDYIPETPLGPMLKFEGTFVAGLTEYFIFALEKYPDVVGVSMSSPGGSLDEGYKLGKAMSDYNLIMWVPKGKACVSACALAFIGGWKYIVGGVLAFHSPYLPAYSPDMELEHIYKFGELTGTNQMFYFAANGFRAQLYMTIATYTDRETYMIFTNTDDLHHFLMIDDRTYEEYLLFKPQPKSVIQGDMDKFKEVVKWKNEELFKELMGDPADKNQAHPQDMLGPRKDKVIP